MAAGNNVRGGIAAPRMPIVVAPTPPQPTGNVAAVLSSVDNPANPGIASFIINGSLPAISGFTWNSSLAATVAMAPNPAAAPPTGTVYYNNTTTQEGGTIFLVNPSSRSIVSATSNFSTIPPVNYSLLFQDITHNGAYNPTGGFQNPNPLDVTSLLANPSPTVAPVLAPPLPPSYGITYIGANGSISTGGSYDAQIQFNLVITNPGWLQELRLYVAGSGTKTDNVANIDHTYAHAGTLTPSSSGQYKAWFHGLVAGVPYDLYVAFVDLRGGVSYGRYLETTAANPIQVSAGSMASMGNPTLVTPIVESKGTDTEEGGAAGSTAFDWLVPTVTLDSNGYAANTWLAEIELIYINQQKPNNIMYANSLSPIASGTYNFIYPQLPVGANSDGSQIVYQLGVRYVDYAGQRSNILLFDQVGSSTLLIGTPTLQTIPNGTTFSVNFSGCTEGSAINNGGGTFAQPLQFNLVISSSVPSYQWLGKIQLLAKEQPSGVPDSDTNPADYIKCGALTGSTFSTPINTNFGPLGNNSIWQLAIQLEDQAGIYTNALPIYLCGVQYTGAYTGVGPSNVNFIADSDMVFTYNPLGVELSNYWTYAGADPTRFNVSGPTSFGGNQLTANTHNGANVTAVCAYSGVIQVISGTTYTLSCQTTLYQAGAGTQYIGIVDQSDVTANNVTPVAIYAYISCPNNAPNFGLQQVTWISTITGPISVALFATNIHGDCGWIHPQFEIGSSATAYKSGTALTEATATLAHQAMSIPIQGTINNAGQLNVSNPQSGSQLPLPNAAPQINDVITSSGTGRGQVNVAPAGGTSGALPYANAGIAVPLTYGIGGAANNSLYALGVVNGTTTAGTSVFTVSAAQIALPSGGTWAYVCKLYGGFTGLGCATGSNPSALFSAPVGTASFTLTSSGWVGDDIEYGFVGVQFMGGCAGGQTVGATTFTMTLPGVGVHVAPQLFFESYAVRTGN